MEKLSKYITYFIVSSKFFYHLKKNIKIPTLSYLGYITLRDISIRFVSLHDVSIGYNFA